MEPGLSLCLGDSLHIHWGAEATPLPSPCCRPFSPNLRASSPRTLGGCHFDIWECCRLSHQTPLLLLPGVPWGPGGLTIRTRFMVLGLCLWGARRAGLSALLIPTHVNTWPLKFNKKHTNYKSYLPSQIDHGAWRVYARTPDFSS